ncbi:leucine-rich repeat-containing protein 43-like isoform X2 [Dicentrarchus labrax]|uniref:leucine-rich repeat-containing protein 43-like isoform X2 n=1 Tax=Dicentrarchus labrax TaxID=13489 RepID=UPI0021F5F1F7|nr:leucine-rich repeat-containing protein 43-like isoform X2 [Dicentrarchus labrax]
MSSNTLSAVLEKQIHRLCLKDFPCGYGSWRKTGYGAGGAETEETDALLDLLSCPHSPWLYDESWSPQAPALRQLAVLAPERLHAGFIYNYFTTLRIVDKGVSVIDDGLLKFSKLEELVLSANKISDIPAVNLPSTLKILELRANQLSALNSLTSCPPPRLHYLGLASNKLRTHEDVSHLTGRHWPLLVCLDLSDCEFQDQQTLLNALSTLPCLRTLVLEGNPFILACCYPGFTVDSLPQLSCLDASWISPEERHCFRGMAKMSGLIVDRASATVSVGRMRGIPDPLLSADENTPDFPVVTYRYFITYEFLSHQTPMNLKLDSESKFDAAATTHVTDGGSSDADFNPNKKETSKLDRRDSMCTEDTCRDTAHVSRHCTSKLTWSESMDVSDTQTYIVKDLSGLKRFLNQGLYLSIEEEKVLSWPAVSEDVTVAKPSRTGKEKKGAKGKEVTHQLLAPLALVSWWPTHDLQSNLVPPKTSLKTKRRNLYQSWSRTPPSEESLALSTSPCKASSKEVKRSMSSVTLVLCTQSLRWKLYRPLKRVQERRSKRTRRRRKRNQSTEEAVILNRGIQHLQKAKGREGRNARWMSLQTTLCPSNWNQ